MGLNLVGRFGWEVLDNGVVIARDTFTNGITLSGVNDMFDKYFLNGTTAAAWYFGLIDNAGFTAAADETDTMSSHSGWTETTAYDEATRVAWAPDNAASQIISNSTLPVVTMNAATVVKGLFMTTDSTKGGTTGILFNTGFPAFSQTVQPGQELKLFYELLGQEG